MLSFIYSSTQGPSNNLPPPTHMKAASSISVTSDELSSVLQFVFSPNHYFKSTQNNKKAIAKSTTKVAHAVHPLFTWTMQHVYLIFFIICNI